jgi:hypothetical protein
MAVKSLHQFLVWVHLSERFGVDSTTGGRATPAQLHPTLISAHSNCTELLNGRLKRLNKSKSLHGNAGCPRSTHHWRRRELQFPTRGTGKQRKVSGAVPEKGRVGSFIWTPSRPPQLRPPPPPQTQSAPVPPSRFRCRAPLASRIPLSHRSIGCHSVPLPVTHPGSLTASNLVHISTP